MPSRVLVKTSTLPLESFENPEWIPSERKDKNGANVGLLAYKNINQRKSVLQNYYSVTCYLQMKKSFPEIYGILPLIFNSRQSFINYYFSFYESFLPFCIFNWNKPKKEYIFKMFYQLLFFILWTFSALLWR